MSLASEVRPSFIADGVAKLRKLLPSVASLPGFGEKRVALMRAAGILRGAGEVLAGITVASLGRPDLYTFGPEVSRLVRGTAVSFVPDAPPVRLGSGTAGILRARKPHAGGRLFGDVVELAWYYEADGRMLFASSAMDAGGIAAHWEGSRWDQRYMSASAYETVRVSPEEGTGRIDRETRRRHGVAAMRFALAFALLAEAENSPIVIERDRKDRSVATVRVSPSYRTPPESAPIGLSSAVVPISGHVKRQRHGPGNSLTKLIYVADYSATRHFDPRWVVSLRDGEA